VLRHYPRAFALVWNSGPREAAAYWALIAGSAAVAPLHLWLSKRIVDEVVQALGATASVSGVHLTAVGYLIAAQVFLWMGSRVLDSLLQIMRDLVSNKANYHVSHVILEKAASLDLAFYESAEFYNLMETASNQASARTFSFVVRFGATMQLLLTLFVMLALVAKLSPIAVIVLVVAALPHVLSAGYFAKQRVSVITGRSAELRQAKYLATLLSAREPFKEIRLLGLHRLLLDRYAGLKRKAIGEDQALSIREQLAQGALGLLATSGTGAVWFYAILQAAARRISIGDLVLYFQASQRVTSDLTDVFKIGGAFYEGSLFLGTLFKFLDLKPDAVSGALHRGAGTQTGKRIPDPIAVGIEFDRVTFRYPGCPGEALSDVSFAVTPGESVAIVGPNGAGKTTLVKLLTRLYDPDEGQILLDGAPLEQYDLEDLRRHFAVVFQDFVQYHFSVRDNIGFGRVEWLNDPNKIRAAAERAGCAALIDTLPVGYETVLGRTLADGVDLSGGEWQKIALARAFFRDAQVLILDEPTAALDPIAEEELFQRFRELTRGKTTFLISHRFSSVRMADRILVLDQGRLVESGTHRDLLALDGMYARMFSLQAARYA
jgi:ATP-binding cassette, subfamily B, bacterial